MNLSHGVMDKRETMNINLLIHPFLVGSKRFLLRVLRTTGIGYKLLRLPIKRIPVSETQAFFNERADKGYIFQSYKKDVLKINPAMNSLGWSHLAKPYCYEHFMMSVPWGTYSHKHPSVITSEGCQLALTSNHPELSQNQHVLFQKISLPKPQTLEGRTLVLATADDNNYYHCLFQISPKIWLLEDRGFDLNKIDWFLLESSTANFQNEIIDGLSIDKERIIDLKDHLQVKAELLMALPSFWKPEPWICKRLRKTFLDKQSMPQTQAQRIYISRSKASYRRILNEDKLLEVLNRHGFSVLHLEGLSIKEQARIFQSSEMIISAHGAALANTVFCEPGTAVIEFRHALHYTDLGGVYEHLSSICELHHFTFLCQGETNAFEENPKFADLNVDVERVEELVNGVFENENIPL